MYFYPKTTINLLNEFINNVKGYLFTIILYIDIFLDKVSKLKNFIFCLIKDCISFFMIFSLEIAVFFCFFFVLTVFYTIQSEFTIFANNLAVNDVNFNYYRLLIFILFCIMFKKEVKNIFYFLYTKIIKLLFIYLNKIINNLNLNLNHIKILKTYYIYLYYKLCKKSEERVIEKPIKSIIWLKKVLILFLFINIVLYSFFFISHIKYSLNFFYIKNSEILITNFYNININNLLNKNLVWISIIFFKVNTYYYLFYFNFFKYLFKVNFLFFIIFFMFNLTFFSNYFVNIKNFNYFSKFFILHENEKEVGPIDDFFLFIILFFITLFFFIVSAFSIFLFVTNIFNWSIISLSLISFLILTVPFNLFLDFGISFTSYIRGTSTSSILIKELFLDIIATFIVFIRFFIQNIRFLFIFLTIFELFEWIFSNNNFFFSLNLVENYNFFNLSILNLNILNLKIFSNIVLNIIIFIILYFYYFLHLFFLLLTQISIYIGILLWLFFFFIF